MLIPNRHGSSNSYRYGFQGQEKDDEIKGEGNSLNYTFRMHDPRVGRFFAVDPLFKEYPELTPYQFSSNSVIDMVEIEGLEGGIIIDDQGKIKPAALGPVNDRYFDTFIDAYRASTYGVKNPSGLILFNEVLSRSPSVQITQDQLRCACVSCHQKANSSHYLAAHDPVMKGVGTGFLAASGSFAIIEAYGVYSAWYGTTGFAATIAESGWVPAIQSQFVLNTPRGMVIGGGSEFLSQYLSKGIFERNFSLDKIDYGDVTTSTLFNGYGSLFIRAYVNIRAEDGITTNSNTETALNFFSGKFSSNINSSVSQNAAPLFNSSAMGTYLQGVAQTMIKTLTKITNSGLKKDFKTSTSSSQTTGNESSGEAHASPRYFN